MAQITTPVYFADILNVKKEEIMTTLSNFNDKYCSQPIMKNAKSKLEPLLETFKMHLAETFLQVKITEYTGSSYEGLKISGDGLEFDAMFIFSGGENLQVLPIESEEGFVDLKIFDTDTAKTSFEKYIDKETNIISSFKMKNKFKGALQSFLNKENEYKGLITIKDHGPAIQFDYKEGDLVFSVDLTLSFQVKVHDEDCKFLISIHKKDFTHKWDNSFNK